MKISSLTGPTARSTLGKTRLDFGTAVQRTAGSGQGQTSHPGRASTPRITSMERLRRCAGMSLNEMPSLYLESWFYVWSHVSSRLDPLSNPWSISIQFYCMASVSTPSHANSSTDCRHWCYISRMVNSSGSNLQLDKGEFYPVGILSFSCGGNEKVQGCKEKILSH